MHISLPPEKKDALRTNHSWVFTKVITFLWKDVVFFVVTKNTIGKWETWRSIWGSPINKSREIRMNLHGNQFYIFFVTNPTKWLVCITTTFLVCHFNIPFRVTFCKMAFIELLWRLILQEKLVWPFTLT